MIATASCSDSSHGDESDQRSSADDALAALPLWEGLPID